MKKYRYKKDFTKILILFVLGLFLVPNINAISTDNKDNEKIETMIFTQRFSSPDLTYKKEFIDVKVDQANYVTTSQRKPMMPLFSKTFEFPLGTKINDISFIKSEIKNKVIEKQVSPVPNKQQLSGKITNIKNSLDSIYTSNKPYPDTWFSYSTGAGINKDNNHVLFLTIHLYPTRYIPNKNIIQYVDEIKITVTYEKTNYMPKYDSTYDLVIISPEEFSLSLQKLILHKNNYGLSTKLVFLENIYNQYPGRDEPEKIKYFIKYAIDEWDTKYVLLVGDIKKLPIRITYASWWEPDILSDLYYSDVYDSSYNFCSWDVNGNNRFGELDYDNNDIDGVDLYADVNIGRIACVNEDELDIVINKIITYEKETYNSDWFKRVILAGGDTFPLIYHNAERDVFEGEITNVQVSKNLPEFDGVLLWSSKKTLNAFSFNRAINNGAGFLTYAGHGFEHGWGTYKSNARLDIMILYYMTFLKYLRNQNKLPIVFFDACLTAKLDFNISDLHQYYPTMINLLVLLTKLQYDTTIHYPCFAWSFITQEKGGAIASIGATRTAYTQVTQYGIFGGAGYLDVSFFKAYEEGVTVGEMLTAAQNDYINFVGRDFFTIEEFILLGDPSLMVGGYPDIL